MAYLTVRFLLGPHFGKSNRTLCANNKNQCNFFMLKGL